MASLYLFMDFVGRDLRPWATSDDFYVRNRTIIFAAVCKMAFDKAVEKTIGFGQKTVAELAKKLDPNELDFGLQRAVKFLACDTAEKQERLLEFQTHSLFTTCFLSAFAVKLMITACGDWRLIAVNCMFFNFVEWVDTFYTMRTCSLAIHAALTDDHNTRLAKRKLAIVVTKCLTKQMLLEYVLIFTSVFAAKVFYKNELVIGFGQFTLSEVAPILAAQVLPEVLTDIGNCLLMRYYGINFAPIFWEVIADWGMIGDLIGMGAMFVTFTTVVASTLP